jgi:hypothetical protein
MMKRIALTLVVGLLLTALLPTATAQNFGPECREEVERTVLVPSRSGFGFEPYTITEFQDTGECGEIRDGRENFADAAAEAAIYCTDRGVEVYDLDFSGDGTLAFVATFAEIDAVPNPPASNTAIDSSGAFTLYRLTSGELQVNGPPNWEGKSYVFIWDGCERPE